MDEPVSLAGRQHPNGSIPLYDPCGSHSACPVLSVAGLNQATTQSHTRQLSVTAPPQLNKMEHSQNVLVTLIAVLFCACVAMALPAARSDSVQGDLSHLVKLIGKLKNLDTRRNAATTADDWAVLDDSKMSSAHSLSTGPASSPSAETLAALKQGFLGLNKRQGAWSYDYGLGGGRFGKRYYGDYGIGGGRFGRDVDHVDIADTNDATL